MNKTKEMSPIKSGGDHDKAKRQKLSDVSSITGVDEDDYQDPLLAPFPMKAAGNMFRYRFTPNGSDPRGVPFKEEETLSIDSCSSCRCKKSLCHEKRFGLYCGLRVAELIEKTGIRHVRGDSVKPLLKVAYNEILRVETVQNVGVLDTYNNVSLASNGRVRPSL